MNAITLRLDKGGITLTKLQGENHHFQTDLTGEVELSARSDRAHTYVDVALVVNISVIEGEEKTSMRTTIGAISAELTTDAFSDRESIQMEKVARGLARSELVGSSAADMGRDLLIYLYQHNEDVRRVLTDRFPRWAELMR